MSVSELCSFPRSFNEVIGISGHMLLKNNATSKSRTAYSFAVEHGEKDPVNLNFSTDTRKTRRSISLRILWLAFRSCRRY